MAVPSKTAGGLIAHCGGIPTALSVEGHEGAIRDGTIDVAMLALPGLQSQGLWKATDSITYTAHAPVEMFLVINEKAWQSLSPGHQAILSEAARLVERQSRDRVAEIETRIYEFAASKGMTIKALTPDQVAEWRACSADMLAAYMERNGELARKLMDAYAKLRTDPCCTAAPSTARRCSRAVEQAANGSCAFVCPGGNVPRAGSPHRTWRNWRIPAKGTSCC